ncbi:hypothetical protein [Nocardia asiatica]|nr:hypothetical protein [Nocardia asiatica]
MKRLQNILANLIAAASVICFGALIGALATVMDWGTALLAWRIG